MIKTLSILCVTASLSLAQQFVHPTRTDYNIVLPNVQMPESLWTNLVFGLDAEIPVINEGATNAVWLSWSSNRLNGRQATLNSQTLRVFKNGRWVFSGDGQDDSIAFALATATTDQTMLVSVTPATTNQSATSFLQYGRTLLQMNSGTQIRYFQDISGFNRTVSIPGGFNTNDLFVIGVVQEGLEFSAYLNGVLISQQTSTASNGTASGGNTMFRFSTQTPFHGDIERALIFNRALTSNEVWSISQ